MKQLLLKLLLRCCYGDKKGSPVESPPVVVKLLISDSNAVQDWRSDKNLR